MTRLCVVTDSPELAQALAAEHRGDVVVLPRTAVLNDANAVAHIMGHVLSLIHI